MTVMRTGIYAILAVVVGVMLVGMLPGQLSNLATPTVAKSTTFQSGAAPESTLNKTSRGDTVVVGRGFSNSTGPTTLTPKSSNFTIASTANSTASAASSAANAANTSADAATLAATTAGTKGNASPYTDLGYYALWVVGLVAALTVYFVSKRMLG